MIKGGENPGRDCMDFYPLALAAREKPAHPGSRFLLWSIAGFFSLALLWFWFAKVDVTVTATGTVIPSTRVRQIQPLETSVVKTIRVIEDQAVSKGQVLMTFDTSVLEKEISSLFFKQAELQAMIDQWILLTEQAKNVSRDELVKIDNQRWQEYQSGLNKLIAESEVLRQESDFAQSQVRQFDRLLPMVQSQLLATRQLWKQRLASQFSVFEIEQRLINLQSTQNEHQSQHRVLLQKQQAAGQAIEHYRQQHLSDWADRIRKNHIEIMGIQASLARLQQRLKSKTLTAPVSGIVKQLSVRSVGEVVSGGQVLLTLVPDEDFLHIEAFVENQDVGAVSAGMSVEVKVQAFPFTRYGTLAGKVISVSQDAIADENGAYLYRLFIKTSPENSLGAGKNLITLLPGMQVQAEIATGRRRLFDFFLSPLLKGLKESFRER